MTLVNRETGEIVVPLDFAEAQELTAKIKGYVSQAWRLLVIAYERQAHKAMRYETWEQYVGEEFGISRSASYRLLDLAYVSREIEAAVGTVSEVTGDVPHAGQISQRAAAEIKPVIGEVTAAIREELAAKPDADPVAVVAEVVQAARNSGGSNPATKGGDPQRVIGAIDPPEDPSGSPLPADEEPGDAPTTPPAPTSPDGPPSPFRAWARADESVHRGLLSLDPAALPDDLGPDERRQLARLRDDLTAFARRIDAALSTHQRRLRSI